MINKGIGAWSPDAMQGMSLDELYGWYDLAVEQLEAEAAAVIASQAKVDN